MVGIVVAHRAAATAATAAATAGAQRRRTTGERRREVKELNLPASTRSLRRVGRCELLLARVRSRATGAVTFRTSFEREARRGLDERRAAVRGAEDDRVAAWPST